MRTRTTTETHNPSGLSHPARRQIVVVQLHDVLQILLKVDHDACGLPRCLVPPVLALAPCPSSHALPPPVRLRGRLQRVHQPPLQVCNLELAVQAVEQVRVANALGLRTIVRSIQRAGLGRTRYGRTRYGRTEV